MTGIFNSPTQKRKKKIVKKTVTSLFISAFKTPISKLRILMPQILTIQSKRLTTTKKVLKRKFKPFYATTALFFLVFDKQASFVV
jgi:hypothetical protein